MAEKLKVLFVASEGVPFAKTGGLADVVGTLPYALQELGVEVKVLMPYYGAVKQGKLPTVRVAEDLEVTLPEPLNLTFDLMAPESPDYPFWFVARDEFYERSQLYGTPKGDYFDNLERFAFFSGAVLPICREMDFQPDLIHCHDWQSCPGAGLSEEPLGLGRGHGRDQDRLDHSQPGLPGLIPPGQVSAPGPGPVPVRHGRPGVLRPDQPPQGRHHFLRCHYHRQPPL